MTECSATTVVTGTGWMGGGIGAIESALAGVFRDAEQEILIIAYAISTASELLFDGTEAALGRGVRVRLVVNRLGEQPADVGSQLSSLAHKYPHFQVLEFTPHDGGDLHAKAVVMDRRRALIGSFNFSRRGLIHNHELGVLLDGPVSEQIARAFDSLAASEYVSPANLSRKTP
jgi:cardiolipin synthase